MAASTDPRSVRSRAWLHQALVELTIERGWDKFTISDLCERAGVGRTTFYEHFGSREEVLVIGLDFVQAELRAQADGYPDRPFAFLGGLLEHVRDARKLVRAITAKTSELHARAKFRQITCELVEEALERLHVPQHKLEETAVYLSGALVEMLARWADGETLGPASRLEATFLRLSEPVVRSARMGSS